MAAYSPVLSSHILLWNFMSPTFPSHVVFWAVWTLTRMAHQTDNILRVLEVTAPNLAHSSQASAKACRPHGQIRTAMALSLVPVFCVSSFSLSVTEYSHYRKPLSEYDCYCLRRHSSDHLSEALSTSLAAVDVPL